MRRTADDSTATMGTAITVIGVGVATENKKGRERVGAGVGAGDGVGVSLRVHHGDLHAPLSIERERLTEDRVGCQVFRRLSSSWASRSGPGTASRSDQNVRHASVAKWRQEEAPGRSARLRRGAHVGTCIDRRRGSRPAKIPVGQRL